MVHLPCLPLLGCILRQAKDRVGVAAAWSGALSWVLVPPSISSGDSSGRSSSGTELEDVDPEAEAWSGAASPTCVGAGAAAVGPARPAGHCWEAVPSGRGVCLGLSFRDFPPPSTGAARTRPDVMSTTRTSTLGACPGGVAGAKVAAAAAAGAAPAALSALAWALRGVPCCLWAEGYLAYGSPAQWAEFAGDVLGCGFSLVRLQQVQVTSGGAGEAARLEQLVGPGPGPGPGRGPGLAGPSSPADQHAGPGAWWVDWHSPDLEALLASLLPPALSGVGRQEPGQPGRQLLLTPLASAALAAVAEALDAAWAGEYSRYSCCTSTSSPAVAAAAAAAASKGVRPSGGPALEGAPPTAFLRLLQVRPGGRA